jgi:hypothetical protein
MNRTTTFKLWFQLYIPGQEMVKRQYPVVPKAARQDGLGQTVSGTPTPVGRIMRRHIAFSLL